MYYPDEQGTAFYTTGLAEGLSRAFLTGHSLQLSDRNGPWLSCIKRKEVRNGVRIERCRGTTFNKDVLLLRLVNMLSYSVALLAKALIKIKKGDIVIAVTSPPSVPFVAKLACFIHRARLILRLEDIYPETLVATGMIRQNSLMNRILERLNRLLYRNVDRLVVLGEGHEDFGRKEIGSPHNHVHLISNWADVDIVSPAPRENNHLLQEFDLKHKFVIACTGNMGRAQAIETMFEAAAQLRGIDGIHFLFVGSGAKAAWMKEEVAGKSLTNITLLGQRPRNDQANFLNACDISIISLLAGMTGAGVPSRLYNIMASGKPIIALANKDSEISLVVREEGIGWVVAPDSADELAQTILKAESDRVTLSDMGRRASIIARNKYTREKIIEKYTDMVRNLAKGVPR